MPFVIRLGSRQKSYRFLGNTGFRSEGPSEKIVRNRKIDKISVRNHHLVSRWRTSMHRMLTACTQPFLPHGIKWESNRHMVHNNSSCAFASMGNRQPETSTFQHARIIAALFSIFQFVAPSLTAQSWLQSIDSFDLFIPTSEFTCRIDNSVFAQELRVHTVFEDRLLRESDFLRASVTNVSTASTTGVSSNSGFPVFSHLISRTFEQL